MGYSAGGPPGKAYIGAPIDRLHIQQLRGHAFGTGAAGHPGGNSDSHGPMAIGRVRDREYVHSQPSVMASPIWEGQ